MWISMQIMHMIRVTHLLSVKNPQECTAHSKLLHSLPQKGEGEGKDVGGGYRFYQKRIRLAKKKKKNLKQM